MSVNRGSRIVFREGQWTAREAYTGRDRGGNWSHASALLRSCVQDIWAGAGGQRSRIAVSPQRTPHSRELTDGAAFS